MVLTLQLLSRGNGEGGASLIYLVTNNRMCGEVQAGH